jgi:hypothetical protein
MAVCLAPQKGESIAHEAPPAASWFPARRDKAQIGSQNFAVSIRELVVVRVWRDRSTEATNSLYESF